MSSETPSRPPGPPSRKTGLGRAPPPTWREYVLEPDEAERTAGMRRRENTGRPLGDESFVQNLGAPLGRNLLPEKRGPQGPGPKPNK